MIGAGRFGSGRDPGRQPGDGPDRTGGIPVLVVEDHPLYASALRGVLEAIPAVRWVGVHHRLGEVPRVPVHAGTVVLLDLGLPDTTGTAGVAALTVAGYRVLVLSAQDDAATVVEALGAGALGYLTKHAERDQIAEALRLVSVGQTYVSPTLAAHLLTTPRSGRAVGPSLTHREREVLILLAGGATDRDIADALGIQVRTVRSYLERVREKTGRRRRPDLTRYAIAEGLLAPGGDEPLPDRSRPPVAPARPPVTGQRPPAAGSRLPVTGPRPPGDAARRLLPRIPRPAGEGTAGGARGPLASPPDDQP